KNTFVQRQTTYRGWEGATISTLRTYIREHTNPTVFGVAGAVVILFVVLGVVYTEPLLNSAENTRDWIGENLGWFYVLAATFFLVTAFILMLSRFGKIRLGDRKSTR